MFKYYYIIIVIIENLKILQTGIYYYNNAVIKPLFLSFDSTTL